jgi:hypothetical protein
VGGIVATQGAGDSANHRPRRRAPTATTVTTTVRPVCGVGWFQAGRQRPLHGALRPGGGADRVPGAARAAQGRRPRRAQGGRRRGPGRGRRQRRQMAPALHRARHQVLSPCSTPTPTKIATRNCSPSGGTSLRRSAARETQRKPSRVGAAAASSCPPTSTLPQRRTISELHTCVFPPPEGAHREAGRSAFRHKAQTPSSVQGSIREHVMLSSGRRSRHTSDWSAETTLRLGPAIR